MKNGIRLFNLGLWLTATLLLPAVSAVAGEAIVHFKNGRALRVLDYREDGDWVYLIISEPKEREKDPVKAARGELEKPEDLVREMGVYRDTIARLEEPKAAGGSPSGSPSRPVSRRANGVIQDPSRWDSTSPSRGYVVENQAPMSAEELAKRQATYTEKTANVPTTADGNFTAEEIQRGNDALDAVDLTKTVAGGDIARRYRQLKMPDYIKERSKQLAEQRRQDRARREYEARQQAAQGEDDDAGQPAAPDTDPADAPPEPER